MLQIQVDVGDANFDAQTEMGFRKGYAGIQTCVMPTAGMPGEGMWVVEFLASYLAAPEAEPAAEAVLHQMVRGFQMNPTWLAQQSRLTGDISGIWSRTHNEMSDMIHQGYMNRSQIGDRSHERRARAFRGEVLIEDPNTRQRYEVPGGSNYYWRAGSGNEFVGTETHSPDLPLHWLQQMKIID
jgi:hypothetical protein